MTDINLIEPCSDSSFTFIIDISKSMYYSLRAVKKVVIDALYDLAGRGNLAAFNVIAFSTSVYKWENGVVPCSPKNIAEASRWVAALQESSKIECSHMEAIFKALDDKRCDAFFLFSNNRPLQKLENVIENAFDAAYGRPIHGVYPSTEIVNSKGRKFMHDVAYYTGGCFIVLEIDELGNYLRSHVEMLENRMARRPMFPHFCKDSETSRLTSFNDEDLAYYDRCSSSNITRRYLLHDSTPNHIPPRNFTKAKPAPWKI